MFHTTLLFYLVQLNFSEAKYVISLIWALYNCTRHIRKGVGSDVGRQHILAGQRNIDIMNEQPQFFLCADPLP